MRRIVALAFVAVLSAAGASAQTIIVRNAPAGATIEVLLNDTRFPRATADANGDATVAIHLPGNLTETDVHIVTEACGNIRRVLLVERGLQPPTSAQPCDRRDVYGFFFTTAATTLVVDMEKPDPAVNIRQGAVPPRWLLRGAEAEERHLNLPPAPAGLVLSAGIGFTSSSEADAIACGTVTTCETNDVNRGINLAASYWIKPFLGAQVSFLKPSDISANGSGDTYRFNSTRTTDLLMVSGMVGVRLGGVRVYGQGGTNYHAATWSTTETVDDVTLAVNDLSQVVRGGTQKFELKTSGWGWQVGGGLEVWVKPHVALYVDGARVQMRGSALGSAEGSMNDSITHVMLGARVHIGR